MCPITYALTPCSCLTSRLKVFGCDYLNTPNPPLPPQPTLGVISTPGHHPVSAVRPMPALSFPYFLCPTSLPKPSSSLLQCLFQCGTKHLLCLPLTPPRPYLPIVSVVWIVNNFTENTFA